MVIQLIRRLFGHRKPTKAEIHRKYRDNSEYFYCVSCAEKGIETPVEVEEWTEYCKEMGIRDPDLLQPACKECAERILEEEVE